MGEWRSDYRNPVATDYDGWPHPGGTLALGVAGSYPALSTLTESTARRIDQNGHVEEIPSTSLRTGDIVEVRAGDRIPADGVVVSGSSSVDTASITGESVPMEVTNGADVFSGSINLDGLLNVRVSKVGSDSTLGRVIALMQDAENIKPAVTRLLERYAGGYMAFVLLLTACLWFLTGSTTGALAVLVASCPCALVLAAPATSIAAIAVASRHGILVKGSAFLEQMANVDAIVFDKTGTLTLGELRLVGAALRQGFRSNPWYGWLAAWVRPAATPSVVPSAWRFRKVTAYRLSTLRRPGVLASPARWGARRSPWGGWRYSRIWVFRPACPPEDHKGPVAGVAKGGVFWGWVLLADQVRPEAEEALAELRELGLDHQLMVTGDRKAEADRVAKALHIPMSNLKPCRRKKWSSCWPRASRATAQWWSATASMMLWRSRWARSAWRWARAERTSRWRPPIWF